MARTKSENFEDIRTAILNAAAKLFATKGFKNTNIIDIGEACQSSKSRMYHYFPSKELILEEMLIDHVNGLLVLAEKITKKPGTPKELFSEYIFTHLKYYEEGRYRHTVLIEDLGYLGEDAKKKVNQAQSTLMGFLSGLLQKVNPEKFSEKHLASAYAMLIYGMLNWTYTWYKPSGKLSLKMLAEEAADFCLNGLSLPGSSKNK